MQNKTKIIQFIHQTEKYFFSEFSEISYKDISRVYNIKYKNAFLSKIIFNDLDFETDTIQGLGAIQWVDKQPEKIRQINQDYKKKV